MAYQRKAGDKVTFWKINHRPKDFSDYEWQTFIEQRVIVIKNTKYVDRLVSMRRGDYFYLCHGDDKSRTQGGVKLIGRIIDDKVEICTSNFY